MFTLCITGVTLIKFILTMSINHSKTENRTISWLNYKTKPTAFIGLKYRSGEQVAWCGGVSISEISFLYTITIR